MNYIYTYALKSMKNLITGIFDIIMFGISGGVIIILGITYFILFLKKHPLSKKEERN